MGMHSISQGAEVAFHVTVCLDVYEEILLSSRWAEVSFYCHGGVAGLCDYKR